MSADDSTLSPVPARLRGILDRTRSTSDPNLAATRLADASSPSHSAHSLPRSVSFAPLPEIPKKKKNGRSGRLGVANRAAIMRRRMQTNSDAIMFDDYADSSGTTITYEGASGDEINRLRALRVKSPGNEQDDPLAAFGRLVKGASKNLWRKVSLSSGGHEPAITIVKPSDGHVHVAGTTDNVEPPPVAQFDSGDGQGGGGVWEEEIDPRYHRAQSNPSEPLSIRSRSPELVPSPPCSDRSSSLSTPAASLDGSDDPPRAPETGDKAAPAIPGKLDAEMSALPEPLEKSQQAR